MDAEGRSPLKCHTQVRAQSLEWVRWRIWKYTASHPERGFEKKNITYIYGPKPALRCQDVDRILISTHSYVGENVSIKSLICKKEGKTCGGMAIGLQ